MVVTPEYSTFLDKEILGVIEDVIKSSLTNIIENSDLSLDKFVGKNEDLKSYFESKYESLDLKGNEVKLDSNKLFEILCNSTERRKIEHRVALTEKGQEQIQVAFSLHDKDLRKPLFDSLDKHKFERHFITATLAGSSTIDINRLGVDKSLPIKDLNKNFETYFPKAENRSIIVSDFDETLTPKKKDEGMLDETKEVLIQYLEVGGKLAISTGSPAETLIPIPSASAKPRFLNVSDLDQKLKPLLNNVVIYANGGATCYLWNKDTQKFENQDNYMKNACQLNNEDFNTSTSYPLLALVIGDGFPGNDQSHAAMASTLRGEMSYINVGDKDFAKQETKIEFQNSETDGPTYQEAIDLEGNPIYI